MNSFAKQLLIAASAFTLANSQHEGHDMGEKPMGEKPGTTENNDIGNGTEKKDMADPHDDHDISNGLDNADMHGNHNMVDMMKHFEEAASRFITHSERIYLLMTNAEDKAIDYVQVKETQVPPQVQAETDSEKDTENDTVEENTTEQSPTDSE